MPLLGMVCVLLTSVFTLREAPERAVSARARRHWRAWPEQRLGNRRDGPNNPY